MLSHLTFDQMTSLLTQIATIVTTIGVIVKLLHNNSKANDRLADANAQLANSVPADLAHKLADQANPTTVVNNNAPADTTKVVEAPQSSGEG